MVDFTVWFRENWFLLLQGTGIVGGLLFTAISIRHGTKARQIGDLLTLAQQHRDLWKEIHERPELARVLRPQVDLVTQPVSVLEEEFLHLVIAHFNTGWLMAREGSLLTLKVLKRDAGTFFCLPIPRIVWEQTKANRDPRFVRFVDACL